MDIPSYTGKGLPNCTSADPEIFFADTDDPIYRFKTNEAKEVCHDCSYIRECLLYAIVEDEVGVWGGKTREERHKIRRRAMRASKTGPTSLGMPSVHS